jgi:hypothetical protein
MVAENIDKEPIKVKHSSLTRFGDSLFKSECPACEKGLLLVNRDMETLQVIATDRCIMCGQMFIYEDIDIMRQIP